MPIPTYKIVVEDRYQCWSLYCQYGVASWAQIGQHSLGQSKSLGTYFMARRNKNVTRTLQYSFLQWCPSELSNQKKTFHTRTRKVADTYPVKEVLNTTSPTWVPVAPNDFPLQIEPSSRTSRQSVVFQGFAAANQFNSISTKKKT